MKNRGGYLVNSCYQLTSKNCRIPLQELSSQIQKKEFSVDSIEVEQYEGGSQNQSSTNKLKPQPREKLTKSEKYDDQDEDDQNFEEDEENQELENLKVHSETTPEVKKQKDKDIEGGQNSQMNKKSISLEKIKKTEKKEITKQIICYGARIAQSETLGNPKIDPEMFVKLAEMQKQANEKWILQAQRDALFINQEYKSRQKYFVKERISKGASEKTFDDISDGSNSDRSINPDSLVAQPPNDQINFSQLAENISSMQKPVCFVVSQVEAFRLHKFKDKKLLKNDHAELLNLKSADDQFISPQKTKIDFTAGQTFLNFSSAQTTNQNFKDVQSAIQQNLYDDNYSVYLEGVVAHIKYLQQSKQQFQQAGIQTWDFNSNKIQSKMKLLQTSKRTDIKRTLIGIQRQDMHGYKIERLTGYQMPLPNVGNNYYRNHSQISSEIIHRKFKGPLYNEAGKICIDLTEKYIVLENFKFQTCLENIQFQLSQVQVERIHQKKLAEEILLTKQQNFLIQAQAQRQKNYGQSYMQIQKQTAQQQLNDTNKSNRQQSRQKGRENINIRDSNQKILLQQNIIPNRRNIVQIQQQTTNLQNQQIQNIEYRPLNYSFKDPKIEIIEQTNQHTVQSQTHRNQKSNDKLANKQPQNQFQSGSQIGPSSGNLQGIIAKNKLASVATNMDQMNSQPTITKQKIQFVDLLKNLETQQVQVKQSSNIITQSTKKESQIQNIVPASNSNQSTATETYVNSLNSQNTQQIFEKSGLQEQNMKQLHSAEGRKRNKKEVKENMRQKSKLEEPEDRQVTPNQNNKQRKSSNTPGLITTIFDPKKQFVANVQQPYSNFSKNKEIVENLPSESNREIQDSRINNYERGFYSQLANLQLPEIKKQPLIQNSFSRKGDLSSQTLNKNNLLVTSATLGTMVGYSEIPSRSSITEAERKILEARIGSQETHKKTQDRQIFQNNNNSYAKVCSTPSSDFNLIKQVISIQRDKKVNLNNNCEQLISNGNTDVGIFYMKGFENPNASIFSTQKTQDVLKPLSPYPKLIDPAERLPNLELLKEKNFQISNSHSSNIQPHPLQNFQKSVSYNPQNPNRISQASCILKFEQPSIQPMEGVDIKLDEPMQSNTRYLQKVDSKQEIENSIFHKYFNKDLKERSEIIKHPSEQSLAYIKYSSANRQGFKKSRNDENTFLLSK